MLTAFGVTFLLLMGLFFLSWTLGGYMLRVIDVPSEKKWAVRLLMPLERLFDWLLFKKTSLEMSYKEYIAALLSFHAIALFLVYLFLRFQRHLVLFLFSESAPEVSPSLALNTCISFITNTDWQCIEPEKILHPFSQMVLLLPQMFLSPAVGLSVFFALLRGMSVEKGAVGNFFRDMVRSLVYILLPLSLLGALFLAYLGTEQSLLNPLALYETIKVLGTNGGGYYADNSANMLENPTSWTTLFQWGYMLLLPMAAFRFLGEKLGNKKYGFRVGLLFCLVLSSLTACMELSESSNVSFWSLDQSEATLQGKQVRIGSFFSSLWTVTTTGTSCGATLCDMVLLKPLSKIIPLALMNTGETIFGGVGVGALSLLFIQIVAMFSAGLLVGRTPELFGKKIDSGVMKLSLLAVMLPVFLIYVALWFQISFGGHELSSSSSQAMTPLIYSMTSTAVNNGSGLIGIDGSLPYLSSVHSILMLVSRLLTLVFALLLGEHLSIKKIHPRSAGSLHIESWTSILWLCFVALSSSFLCFCALWIIGPCLEFYMRVGG